MKASLRVLHVVSLISPTGEYGGPTRVALNQAQALVEAGHSVVIAGGSWGTDPVPVTMHGIPVKLFAVHRLVPGTGFAGICSPRLLTWMATAARTYDVLHVHLARDLVTMPVALLAGRLKVPYVLQTHGMIDASDKVLARVLDAVATGRALRDAATVFHLTDQEHADLVGVAGPQLRLTALRNGIRPETTAGPPSATRDSAPEVLYLARLHKRKRPLDFVDAASVLLPKYPHVRFRLIGPDEGEGERVSRAITHVGSPRLQWDGPVSMEKTAMAMANAAVYVLPSVEEPYPMTVLEAMSHGCPVVVTDSCGLAPLVARSGSGIVTSPGSQAVGAAVEELLVDPERRRAMGQAAQRTVHNQLNMKVVTQTLLSAYEDARLRKKDDAE